MGKGTGLTTLLGRLELALLGLLGLGICLGGGKAKGDTALLFLRVGLEQRLLHIGRVVGRGHSQGAMESPSSKNFWNRPFDPSNDASSWPRVGCGAVCISSTSTKSLLIFILSRKGQYAISPASRIHLTRCIQVSTQAMVLIGLVLPSISDASP